MGEVITFYSYKGGVGRTLALANVAALLSQWGYRVLCIDWDLEAPGLHLYFNPWIDDKERPGLIELIQAQADGMRPDWTEFLTEVRFAVTTQPVLFLRAGRWDESYVTRMQRLDWNQLYEVSNLGRELERWRDEWKSRFDFILVDSRTGVTDIGGICTIQLPDILTMFFTANQQSLDGAVEYAQRVAKHRAKLPVDRARLLVLPVVTRLEMRSEYDLAQLWMSKIESACAEFFQQWMHQSVSPGRLLNHIGVPYIPRWSFGEELPVVKAGTENSEDIGYHFETLSALIAHRLDKTEVLVNDRAGFIKGARARQEPAESSPDAHETSSSGVVQSPVVMPAGSAGRLRSTPAFSEPKGSLAVFISYAHEDRLDATVLAESLRSHDVNVFMDDWIVAGDSISQKVASNLRECAALLVLFSAASVQSKWVSAEIELAREFGKIVLPIRVRGFRGVSPQFDFSSDAAKSISWQFESKPENIVGAIFEAIQADRTRVPSLRDVAITAGLPFLDRDEVRSALEELLSPSGNSLLEISGLPGVGKSYVTELLRHAARASAFGVIAPAATGPLELQDLTFEILSATGISDAPPPGPGLTTHARYIHEYIHWMIERLRFKGKLWCLVLDGFRPERVGTELMDFGRQLVASLGAYRYADVIRLILVDSPDLYSAGRSAYARSFMLEFGDINEDHLREYARARQIELSESVRNTIHSLWTVVYKDTGPPPRLRDLSRVLLRWTDAELKTQGMSE